MTSDETKQDFPPLERICDECGGSGRLPDVDHYSLGRTCWTCDGTGRTITEFGETVLVFIRSRLDVRVQL